MEDSLKGDLAQDIIRYGNIMSDKGLFDSNGKPVRVRLIQYKNTTYYYYMVAGQLEELINISEI
jgi:hypothetical protein